MYQEINASMLNQSIHSRQNNHQRAVKARRGRLIFFTLMVVSLMSQTISTIVRTI